MNSIPEHPTVAPRRHVPRCILLMLLVIAAAGSAAADNDIQFHHGTVKDGLSQAGVLCIFQDSRGFMWFGTQDGLNRYDGYEYRIFRHDPADPGTISDSFILMIAEDSTHTLWVGTRGEPDVLDRYDPAAESFRHVRRDSVDLSRASRGESKPSYLDPSGTLWTSVAGGGGLLRTDLRTGQKKQYRHNPADPASLADDKVFSVAGDHTGAIWVGTRNGLERYDPKSDGFVHYRHDPKNPASLSDNFVWPILVDRSGTLWVGSYIGGLDRYDRASDSFTHFHHDESDPRSLSSDVIYSLRQDASGLIWVGTGDHGVDYFHPEMSNFRHYLRQPANPNSLADNNVLSIAVDHSGIVWIGTSSGLNRWDRARGSFTVYRHNPSNPRSIADDNVQCILEDRSGTLWFGTLSSGLDRFDAASGQFVHYRNNPSDPRSISDNRIYALCEDRKGDLWVGTYGGGLCRLDKASGTFHRYLHDPGNPSSLGGESIWSLLEDRSGRMWIALFGNGLDRYDPADGTFSHFVHFDSIASSLSDNLVITLGEDRSGVVWVGTGNGLSRYRPETNDFRNYGLKEGLPNTVIVGLQEDNSGNLWIGTNKGLSRLDPQRNSFRNFTYNDGLQGDEFNQASGKDPRTGTLLFGGTNGLTVFRPELVKDNSFMPPVVFSSFVRYNTDDEAGRPIEERGIDTKSRITLSYKDNVAIFRFAALNYFNSSGNKYAYRLEGYDDQWIQIGTDRRATFTNLDAGHYVLRVRGSNDNNVWNETGASLEVVVTPPWWKTTWAYGIYGFLVVGFLFSARRVELNRREQKAKLRESQLHAKAVEAEKRALQAENDRKTKELEDARNLQLSMLPKEVPRVAGYEIAVFMKTATEVGGDYYDFSVSREGILDVAFGDATGHGMQAGTIVTLIKGLFVSHAPVVELRNFFNHCSRVIKDIRLGRLYMALTVATFREKSVSLSSAAMPPAYLFRCGDGSVEEILLKAVPLGSMKNFPYAVHETVMEPGDTLLLCTDGLPEQKNGSGEMFDYARVVDCFRESVREGPEAVIGNLMKAGEHWMNGAVQDDDITLLVIRRERANDE